MLASLPELVPARMINEYAYCPRLFFPEWVDSQRASNVDGVHRHQRAGFRRRRATATRA
jgi:hypothetical protein